MKYTPEQLDLIRRMGEVSKRIDEVVAEHRTIQTAEARGLADTAQTMANAVQALADVGRNLTGAMERTAEIHRLCRQSGDLFREYLDTLR